MDLCGHATLASSFVILNFYESDSKSVCFHTRSGLLTVRRAEGLYRMDFPIYEQEEIPVTDAMENAFGARPVRAFLGVDLVCIFEGEETVRAMTPDQMGLSALPGRIQNATARGREADCVSRSFCPKLAIVEDPVCGSAHCQIAPYWAGVLGKNAITAYQASKRGGTLHCELTGNGRFAIGGEAVLVAKSEVVAL